MKARNVMILELRTEEGRCQVDVDLVSLNKAERVFLFGLFQSASQGAAVGFGVGPTEDKALQVLQLTFLNPAAPTVTASVRDALREVH